MVETISIIFGMIVAGWAFNAFVYLAYQENFDRLGDNDPIDLLFKAGRVLALVPFGLFALVAFIFSLIILGLIIIGIIIVLGVGFHGLIQVTLGRTGKNHLTEGK